MVQRKEYLDNLKALKDKQVIKVITGVRRCGKSTLLILRHTFASNCVQLNFDTKTLSEILGHTNVSMTLNRYVHSSLQIKRKYMELVNIA